MNTSGEIQVELKFVRAGLSKKGKPWLRVSNGLDTVFLQTDVHPDEFAIFEKGDEFTGVVQIDAFDPYKTKLLQIVN